MAAGAYNLFIEQGSTYDQTFTWKDGNGNPVNLTGYTARMQWRSSVGAAQTVFDTNADATVTLGGAAGTIRIQITATKTATLNATTYVYDLELTSGSGIVTRLLQGSVTISPEVTRA